MKQIVNKIWPLALIIVLVLSACGANEPEPTPVDPAAIFTAAAETVAAQMTQTAAAWTPTPQPTATQELPTATPETLDTPANSALGTPPAGIPTIGTGANATATIIPLPGAVATQAGPICDNSAFIADITIPDYTEMVPGNDFEKIWRIQNTGVCTWDEGYYLAFAFGNERLDGPGWQVVYADDFVGPGETKDIGMWMTAPLATGEYTSCWQMVNDRGVPFGTALCAIIKVVK